MPSDSKLRLRQTNLAVLIVATALSIYTYFQVSEKQQRRASECLHAIAERLTDKTNPDVLFQQDFKQLQILVERSLVARSIALEISNRVALDTDRPISSKDLFALKQGTEDYLSIRAELYNIANTYECATDVDNRTLASYGIDPSLRIRAR